MDIARRPDDDTRVQPDRPRRPNPLATLPDEWRESVAFFFAFHSDILKGTAGIVARIRMWTKEHGLQLDDFKVVMRRLMQPARCAAFSFAGQLLAALAEEVAKEIGDRERRQRMADDQYHFDRQRRQAAPAAEIGQAVGDVLARWRAEDGVMPPVREKPNVEPEQG